MHPQWHPPQGYAATPKSYPGPLVEPQGLPRRSQDSWHVEEAYRVARVANEALASAEHRFARETEQLHTTLAAFEHSYQTLVRQHRALRAELDRMRDQNQQIRRESEQANAVAMQRVEDAERLARQRAAEAEKLNATKQRLSHLVRQLRYDH